MNSRGDLSGIRLRKDGLSGIIYTQQNSEDRRQKTEGRRWKEEVRPGSVQNPWLMKNAGQYKFRKAPSDTDLRRFTLVFGLHCFNPCLSVESVVNAKKAAIIFTKLCKTKPISEKAK